MTDTIDTKKIRETEAPEGVTDHVTTTVTYGFIRRLCDALKKLQAQRDEAHAALAEVTERAQKAEAFKAYVHKRLDDAGVPTHIDDAHAAAGCRIGGRLDHVLARAEATNAKVEAMIAVLDDENGSMDCDVDSSVADLSAGVSRMVEGYCAWTRRYVMGADVGGDSGPEDDKARAEVAALRARAEAAEKQVAALRAKLREVQVDVAGNVSDNDTIVAFIEDALANTADVAAGYYSEAEVREAVFDTTGDRMAAGRVVDELKAALKARRVSK